MSNGCFEHLCGIVFGFWDSTRYISRSILEDGYSRVNCTFICEQYLMDFFIVL